MGSKVWKFSVSIAGKLQPKALGRAELRLPSTKPSLPILTLYTKQVCPLCDDAKAVLESFKHRFHFEEVDITEKGNEAWFSKYKYEIPVFHLNGTFLMKHRVNEELLEKELRKCEDNQDAT
ncbi:glutaredoxin-like protein C5orf63 homolog isoform X1 [Porites lutea]|uniref:glutaredoxin-like protein C5orf63 homolog isoform X1 n=1 Tax=Porites lutea TaxID=51062 RepID=UPI003CC51335